MFPRQLNRVVLVDDSTLDNKLHKRVIERTGLVQAVSSFTMAEDALAYFRGPCAMPADLILLDINMPRMDGFEMLDALLAEFEPSAVVMLTTSLNPHDKARAARYGAIKDYIQKPLTEEKFRRLCDTIGGMA